MGYEIELCQINEYNRLAIEMFDREVFRCDIRNLMFNMTSEDDPVCQRAVKAVEEAKFRMCTDTNTFSHGSFGKGRRELSITENKSSLQGTLPSNSEMLYELHSPGTKLRTTLSDNSRAEEKVGKVTIMEDKNTFLTRDRGCHHSSSDDDTSKSED